MHENLRLGAVNRRARAGWRGALDEVLRPVSRSCSSAASQAAATLSGGEQQMLAIGRGLMAAPRR